MELFSAVKDQVREINDNLPFFQKINEEVEFLQQTKIF